MIRSYLLIVAGLLVLIFHVAQQASQLLTTAAWTS